MGEPIFCVGFAHTKYRSPLRNPPTGRQERRHASRVFALDNNSLMYEQ